MINILVRESASYQNLTTLKEILRGRNWKLKNVSIIYSPGRGLPDPSFIDKWPFKAIFDIDGQEVAICFYALTVGYGGTGPHDLASILDFLGVSYIEEDIYTKRQMDYDVYIRLQYPAS